MIIRKYIAASFVAVGMLTVNVASAAGPEPKKLDDIVHLGTSSGADCSGGINSAGRTFTTRIVDRGFSSNGITGFTIPPGRAIVMTWVEISAVGGDAYDSVQYRLFRSQGAGGGTEYLLGFGELNSRGNGSFEATFPNGVVIRSLENLCAQVFLTSAIAVQGIIHGFLVDD